MKFFIVLLAILKYALLVILFLLLLVLVLALILMISPIRYKAVINYKDQKLYYNADVTYLGKIVGFKIKGVKNKFKAYVRLLNKKVYLQPDDKQKSKKQTQKSSKKTDSTKKNTGVNNTSNKSNVDNKTTNTAKATKEVAPEVVSKVPLEVVQKITPTTTLEEANTSNISDLHNTKDKTITKTSLDVNYENSEKTINKNIKSQSLNNDNVDNTVFTKDKEPLKDEKVKSNNASDDDYADNKEKSETSENSETSDSIGLMGKINKLLENINFYIESYKTYPYRDKLFKKFKKIFTNIKDALFPKVFDCSGEIFIQNPATTGQFLGFLYMLHGLNRTFNVSVDANFETEKNDFTALISGRIIIIKLVYPVFAFVWLGLKAEAKRRGISRFKLIKILINNE